MKPIMKSDLSVVVRTYTDKDGKEKKVWRKIGELATFRNDDGTTFTKCELFHMPGSQISVFTQKETGSEAFID